MEKRKFQGRMLMCWWGCVTQPTFLSISLSFPLSLSLISNLYALSSIIEYRVYVCAYEPFIIIIIII
jgi:hypothetical protein